MKPIWELLAMTGMRLTAALEIKEGDIGETDFRVFTKFRKYVTYSLTPEIRQIIETAKQFKADNEIESPYLFTKRNGVAWKKDYFNHRLHRMVDRVNKSRQKVAEKKGTAYVPLPQLTAHQLRHMAGTILAEQNVSADIIQAGLAHDSRASAESYIDQTQQMRDSALSTIAKAITDIQNLSKKSSETRISPHSVPESPKAKNSQANCPLCPFISLYLK